MTIGLKAGEFRVFYGLVGHIISQYRFIGLFVSHVNLIGEACGLFPETNYTDEGSIPISCVLKRSNSP